MVNISYPAWELVARPSSSICTVMNGKGVPDTEDGCSWVKA